jgi:hypothetical protein
MNAPASPPTDEQGIRQRFEDAGVLYQVRVIEGGYLAEINHGLGWRSTNETPYFYSYAATEDDALSEVFQKWSARSTPEPGADDPWKRGFDAARNAELFEDGCEADLAEEGVETLTAAYMAGRLDCLNEIELEAACSPETKEGGL